MDPKCDELNRGLKEQKSLFQRIEQKLEGLQKSGEKNAVLLDQAREETLELKKKGQAANEAHEKVMKVLIANMYDFKIHELEAEETTLRKMMADAPKKDVPTTSETVINTGAKTSKKQNNGEGSVEKRKPRNNK